MEIEPGGKLTLEAYEAVFLEGMAREAKSSAYETMRSAMAAWLDGVIAEHPETIANYRVDTESALPAGTRHLFKRAHVRRRMNELGIPLPAVTLRLERQQLFELKEHTEEVRRRMQESILADGGMTPEEQTELLLGNISEDTLDRIRAAHFEDTLADIQLGIGIANAIGRYLKTTAPGKQ